MLASAAMARSTSRPVMPGIWMSISTSAGLELADRGEGADAVARDSRRARASASRSPIGERVAGERLVFGDEGLVSHGRPRPVRSAGSRMSTWKPVPGAERTSSRAWPSKSSSKRRRRALRPTPLRVSSCRRTSPGGQAQPAPSSLDRELERVGPVTTARGDRAPCRRRSAARCRGRCCSRPAAAA